MTGLRVELATPADIAAIQAIDPRVGDIAGRAAFLERAVWAGECWLARRNGEIDGFAVFDRSLYDQPFVSLLYVVPERRGAGVATALMMHIETICPGEKLFTSTNESNTPMQRLCERLGFIRSGWIENLDKGDPEIIYFKRLVTS
jgi:GNAT superfamily N-acetyltransferase